MRKTLTMLGATLAVALGALAPAGVAGTAKGQQVNRAAYGLTGAGALIRFDATNTARARRVGTVAGLAAGERLVGIDYRRSTSLLYGLGDKSNVYEIDVRSARAILKSALKTAGGEPVALQGTRFGIDFNPTVDRLRVVSDAGQNLRANIDTGVTTVDRPLAYAAGDANASARPQVVGIAYTNNDNDSYGDPPLVPFNRPMATGTTLFALDSALDSLAVQDPPNEGTLRMVGRLRQAATPAVGFDVFSVSNSAGDTAANVGYASLSRGGRARLYKVNLRTGRARPVKGGGGPFGAVEDIAVVPR